MDKKRHLQDKLTKLLALFPAVALIGPRQSGKSTLCKILAEAQKAQTPPSYWSYYDLERPDHYQLIASDPLGFFSRKSAKVIIEEAQIYPELFQILRSVIDENPNIKGRFLLTGSSSPPTYKANF